MILPFGKLAICLREVRFLIIVLLVWIYSLYAFSDTPLQWLADYWPIIFISFFSATVANATAVGGGFIFLPLFSFAYDLTALASLKLALSTQAFGMTSGAMSWPRNLIIWRYFFIACGASGVGMIVGTFFWVPSNELIHGVFGYASVFLGIILLLEVKYGKIKTTERPVITTQKLMFFIIFCMLGGLITAWVSIGIGEIVAIWMLFQARFSISSSVATGVAVLAFCSLLGFLCHWSLGGIVWTYLMFTSLGVVLGGRAGAKLGVLLASAGQKLTSSSGAMRDSPLKVFVALVILADGVVVLLNNT